MPHSSGGGSSGGGSHSGSSGGSSFGGSSGGGFYGGKSRPMPKNSSNYFSGSNLYVSYNGGHPEYFYSNQEGNTRSVLECIVRIIYYSVPFLIASIFCLTDTFHKPQKLDLPYDTKIIIEDTHDFLTEQEESRVRGSMVQFQQSTGITPSLQCITISDYENAPEGYYTLSNYAYAEYVKKWKDERHWLLVYAQDDNNKSKWYWEGMQGDDTDPILTTDWTNTFNTEVQNGLYRGSIANAFQSGFSAINEGIMKPWINRWMLGIGLGLLLISMCCALPSIIGLFAIKKYSDAYPVEGIKQKYQDAAETVKKNDIQEDVCEYCGGIYVHGLHLKCPHCNAPIKVRQQTRK